MLSPRLKCPFLIAFRIVLPAPTTTSLRAVRHASFPHPSAPTRALQLVRTKVEPSPQDPSSRLPRPLPFVSSTARALLAPATANARSRLPLPHPPHSIPWRPQVCGAYETWAGEVKVAGPRCPTPYGVRRSKLGKLGHGCLPFPGGSWWSFSGRGLGAETSSVPLPPLHAGDAE